MSEQNKMLATFHHDIEELQRSLARLDYAVSSLRYETKIILDNQDNRSEGFQRSRSDRHLSCPRWRPSPTIDEAGYVLPGQ